MPRFFFDTYDGESLLTDDVGLELASVEDAKAEAHNALPDMAKDTLRSSYHRTFVVSVRDEAGQVVLRAALSLVVEDGAVDS